MNIPYGRQWIDEEDIQAVVEVLHSDYLTTGPKISEFEKAVSDYVGARYAVAVSNGTAALHTACLAAGIGPGDEVITSAITFAASANCALYCGAVPVFADIRPDSYNVDPKDIERKITSRTKAIIPVHFTGQPCEMDAIQEIAQKHHLLVIEDAAHALGADYKGRKIGTISDMTTFSFHPVKHITTGEGGMIVTNNKELYENLVSYHTHGITRKAEQLISNDGDWYYEQQNLGYNYRITDIQAALGISQLKKLDYFIARRREIAQKYQEAFKEIEDLILPKQVEGCNNSWHLFVIQVKGNKRKVIFNTLKNEGIGVNVHYIPVYKFPYYQQHGYQGVHCKNAEEYYERCISLPIYPKLTDIQQDYVIEKIKKLFE